MTTRTLTLTDFVLARIAEDEAVARAADIRGGQWVEHVGWNVVGAGMMDGAVRATTQSRSLSTHIALHDPARVLAECEAKRRIIRWATANAYDVDGEWGDGCDVDRLRDGHCGDSGGAALLEALSPLADVYSDHPDHREVWA